MPAILKKQLNGSVSICLWQIQETEPFFLQNYIIDKHDINEIQNLKLESRRLEKWACRAALAELTGDKKISISYTSNGQPISPNGFISFSHTKDLVLVALSDRPVGIDIELCAPRILKLKHKFMNQQEMIIFDPENSKDVTLIWCAKEAIFKWYAKGDVDFSNDILITNNPLQALLKNEKEIPLYQMEYLDYMIVIAC